MSIPKNSEPAEPPAAPAVVSPTSTRPAPSAATDALRRGIALALLLGSLLVGAQAVAHDTNQSYVFLNIEDERIGGRVEFALADLNEALGFDFPTDRGAGEADLAPKSEAILAYATDRIFFAVNGESVQADWSPPRLYTIELAQYVALDFTLAPLPGVPERITVRYEALLDAIPAHRALVVVENEWRSGTFENEAVPALILGPGDNEQTVDLSSSSVMRGIATMVALGTHHIWIGIDHILFLMALLLPAVLRRVDGRWVPVERFRDGLINVVAIVTLFTVAHTITLSLATLGVVQLPSRLVESIIAASIAIAALDIVRPIFHSRIWIVVFVFGLFHGFGFASALGEIGIPGSYLVYSLLGFNIGVELGQLAIVGACFPVLYLVKDLSLYRVQFLRGSAAVLIAVSLYWFTERAFDVDLPAGAIANTLLDFART